MHFSKAYDCIPHDLLISELEACGPDKTSLHLFSDYFSNSKQKTNIGSSLRG